MLKLHSANHQVFLHWCSRSWVLRATLPPAVNYCWQWNVSMTWTNIEKCNCVFFNVLVSITQPWILKEVVLLTRSVKYLWYEGRALLFSWFKCLSTCAGIRWYWSSGHHCAQWYHNIDVACLDQRGCSAVGANSVWPFLESLFLSSLCYSCSQHSCVDLNGSLVSSSAASSWSCCVAHPLSPISCFFSLRSLSVYPLQITTAGIFPGHRLRATHEREGRAWGKGAGVVPANVSVGWWGERAVRLLPSPTSEHGISQAGAFGAIFVSRQQREMSECSSVGKLTTAPLPEVPATTTRPPSTPPTPPPLLTLVPLWASAYMHTFTISSGRLAPTAACLSCCRHRGV